MKDKVNSYFSVILLVIAGIAAMWVITKVATKKTTNVPVIPGSEAAYEKLQQSILQQ